MGRNLHVGIVFIAALVLAFGMAACAQPEPAEPSDGAPAEESPSGGARTDEAPAEGVGGSNASPREDASMQQTSECVNRADGYAVEYPSGWHVNTGEVLGPCALFDPDSIVVPLASEIPIDIAIMLDVELVPFETASGETFGRRNVVRESTTVDGREAVRIQAETTGDGLYDAGIRFYQYFVDLGDSTVVASTYDAGDVTFERKRRILDGMMATFDLLPVIR